MLLFDAPQPCRCTLICVYFAVWDAFCISNDFLASDLALLSRYILSCVCSDHCGSMWLSCFNDAGKIIMGGMSADELHELSLSDPSAYDGIWQRSNFQSFIFKVCTQRSVSHRHAVGQRYLIARMLADGLQELFCLCTIAPIRGNAYFARDLCCQILLLIVTTYINAHTKYTLQRENVS